MITTTFRQYRVCDIRRAADDDCADVKIVEVERHLTASGCTSTVIAHAKLRRPPPPAASLSRGMSIVICAAFSRATLSHGDGLRPFLSAASTASDIV